MRILFLGTGAADWPQQKKDTDTFFRRNASVLVDECILIDPGPGVVDAIDEYAVDVTKIKYILNTHKHRDHFNPDTLKFLVDNGAAFIEVDDEREFNLGNYTIKSVRGNHSIAAIHYLISDGKSRMFYGMDGAWLMYHEVKAIKESAVDLAVLDGTVGFIDGDYRIFEHNNLNMVLEMKKSLSPYVKRFYINHMAYTLHDDHETLASDMSKHGIEVAYDGLKIEF